MRVSRSFVVAVLVIGLACGDSNAPPVPTGMTLTSGNNQSGYPGEPLALPLRVTVTGAGGAAFPGARVTWVATTGSAAFGSPFDTTDVNGEASTTVIVGVTPGNLVVTATVTGVPAVPFTLTALNPCTRLVPLSTDTLHIGGVLTNFDCQLNGPFFTDFYSVSLPGQAGFVVTMTSSVFDAFAELYHLSGPFLGVNDDLDSTHVITDARFAFIAALGTYVLAPSSFDPNQTGPYTIDVAPRSQALTGCTNLGAMPWITRGVAIADQVEATDCVTVRGTGGRGFGDRVLIALSPTRPLSVTLASAAFNPRLELYEETQQGEVFRLAANGSGGVASLNYTPVGGPTTPSTVYRLEITSVDTVQTGAYTLNESGTVPVGSVTVLPVGPGLWRPADAPARAKARAN